MAGMPKFDPWLALEKMGLDPAATAATAANRPNAAIAASAASAAGGQATNPESDPAALAGLPAAWRTALAQIETTPCPAGIELERWVQVIADARYLMVDWGHALYVTGWDLGDLFSAHRVMPLVRLDGMGLCLLLQGRKVGPILADQIVIHAGAGIQQFRRFHAPPAETVNLWELDNNGRC
jgi:hypothetical protein